VQRSTTTGFVASELARNRQQPQLAYRAAWLRTLSSLTPDDFPLTTSVIHQLPDVAGEAQFELGLATLAHGLLRQPRHSPETPCHALPRMRHLLKMDSASRP
jgi:hypothetical protein